MIGGMVRGSGASIAHDGTAHNHARKLFGKLQQVAERLVTGGTCRRRRPENTFKTWQLQRSMRSTPRRRSTGAFNPPSVSLHRIAPRRKQALQRLTPMSWPPGAVAAWRNSRSCSRPRPAAAFQMRQLRRMLCRRLNQSGFSGLGSCSSCWEAPVPRRSRQNLRHKRRRLRLFAGPGMSCSS